MKIWCQHGSEHSANLVMIGHFMEVTDATKTKEIIDKLTERVRKDGSVSRSPSHGYSNSMLDLLTELHVASIAPQELEQFLYDVCVEVEGSNVVVTTEEIDVSAFLKVMVARGARVEVYSAHHYPNSQYVGGVERGDQCRR